MKKVLPKLEAVDRFEVARDKKSLLIRLAGPCAQIPSSSNTHVIARFGKRFGIRKSNRTLSALSQLTGLYQKWLYETESRPPYFGSSPVRIVVYHAYKPRRFDSHNVPKAVCDWLQAVNIIDDDTHAECFCVKAQDYPERCSQTETIIKITRRADDFPEWESVLFPRSSSGDPSATKEAS